MKRLLLSLLLFALLVGLALVGSFYSSIGQAPTEVKGIIDSNTMWTKANTPYTLTGPILVNSAITLTIEPGVTVNLGNYYIEVNGSLNARGTISDNIHFNGGAGIPGAITFTKYSPSWNEQTGKGSIIENAVMNASSIAISIGDTSPKINNNSITGTIWTAASTATGQSLTTSTPIITNNCIVASGYGVTLQINTSPIIVNNTIKGKITTGSGLTIISGNYIEGSIESNGEKDEITGNVLFGADSGYGIRMGFGVIERNLISNYHDAIKFWLGASPIIRNNTLVNNVNAISVPGYLRSSYSPQIYWNNIYNNSDYSINLYTDETHPTSNVNATYNWWGTTDVQTINQRIHDNADDYNLGSVNFVPFLTEPNSQVVPDITISIPTPSSNPTPHLSGTTSQNPTATLNQPSGGIILFGLDSVGIIMVALLAVIVVLLVFVAFYLRKRR